MEPGGVGRSVCEAVLICRDEPLPVSPDEHPGRPHPARGGDVGLARHDDPALTDHHGRIVAEETDFLRLIDGPRALQRAGETSRHVRADLVPALTVAPWHDHR